MSKAKGLKFIVLLVLMSSCHARYGHLTTRVKTKQEKKEQTSVAKIPALKKEKIGAQARSEVALSEEQELNLAGPIEPVILNYDTLGPPIQVQTEMNFVRDRPQGDTLTREQAIAEYRRANTKIVWAFVITILGLLLAAIGAIVTSIIARFLLRSAKYTYDSLPKPKEVADLRGLMIATNVLHIIYLIISVLILILFIIFLITFL